MGQIIANEIIIILLYAHSIMTAPISMWFKLHDVIEFLFKDIFIKKKKLIIIIIRDEFWVHHYDPENKKYSME